MSYTVLGICGGNGVILHPFKKHLIGNIEPRQIFYTKDNKQWASNFGDIPMEKLPWLVLKGTKIDLIIGAPDCGHSSVLAYSRAKKKSDPNDNPSLNMYFRLVKQYQPSMWVMENLPALLDTITIEELNDSYPNYDINFICDSVSIYGNSQLTRKRLLIVAIRKDGRFRHIKVTKPKRPMGLPKTGELLRGLTNKHTGHNSEGLEEIITLYAGFKMRVADIKEEWLTTRKQHSRWLVEGRNFSTAPGVYRNVHNEYPMTARKANRQFNPDGEMMSPRELARIQGVPDSFVIYTERENGKYWVNKGRATVTKCPPYQMGTFIYKLIQKNNGFNND